MIIRHAEKHQPGSHGKGVDEFGHHAKHELTIKGWQRAGALVGFFAPPGGFPTDLPVQTPRAIYASDNTRNSPSLRAQHTVGPLAAALGLTINHDFEEGEEAQLAEALLQAPSPVLVSWHHGRIAKLARRIGGIDIGCPDEWPDDRFDVVWILQRGAQGGWTFQQVPQCLLSDDRATVF